MDYRTLAEGIEYISDNLLSKWARRYTKMLSESTTLSSLERNDIQYLVSEIGKEYQRRFQINLK